MDYTLVVNGKMKRSFCLFLGLLFALIAASCGNGAPTPPTAEAISTQTNVSLSPSRVSPASLPKICKCVLRFNHINIEEGLSQSSVRVVFQDSRGFLWFGTEDGLNRYDGYAFKIYKPDPDVPTSLSDRWITAITEDKDGYLWIGTRLGGLNRYDPRTESFTHFLHSDTNLNSLSDNHINVLYLDKDNNLWLGTMNGLDLFNRTDNTFKHYKSTSNEENAVKNITAIYQDSHGRFWIGTASGGLSRFNPQDNKFTT